MARRHVLLLQRYLANPSPRRLLSLPKHRNPFLIRRWFISGEIPGDLCDRILLITEKPGVAAIPEAELREVRDRITLIADELLSIDDVTDLAGFMDENSIPELIRRYPNGLASVKLLSRLGSRPQFTLEVFSWRRKQANAGMPIVEEEYTKAIALAGRGKNVGLPPIYSTMLE